jgi:hypothetical protein
MGMYYSAYFAYGARIPEMDTDLIEDADLPQGVGYLLAGGYDRDMFFLTTQCKEVDLGQCARVTPNEATDEQRTAWDQALRASATELGVDLQSEPGWLVIPDLA